jgi:hypothetical protein
MAIQMGFVIFTMIPRFSVSSKNRGLKVLQIFLTKDEVKKKKKISVLFFTFFCTLLFLKLAKLSKENK